MNKILVGLIVGAVLGMIDGATAWFAPEVRSQMLGIIIGSTMKGIIAGIAAGWYARRVQSVPKGIVFGFVVGLLLAFAVAAMPGNHYWWQIMVPGSILGGVVGWATQRYGRPASARGAAATAMVLVFALTGVSASYAHDHDHAKPTSNAAFEKLKGLTGTWNANLMTPDGDTTTVEYRVTAGGSVVMETMFVGKPEEMINMYTVDRRLAHRHALLFRPEPADPEAECREVERRSTRIRFRERDRQEHGVLHQRSADQVRRGRQGRGRVALERGRAACAAVPEHAAVN